MRGRDLSGAVAEAQERINRNVKLPTGYRIDWAGEFEWLQQAKKRLAIIMPVTFLMVVVLLYGLFNSWRDSLLALLGLPFAVSGGLVALYVTGLDFSISAAIGFISLFGVSVMSGILILNGYYRVIAEGVTDRIEAMFRAVEEQMRPILMMTLSAAIGLLPAAISTGIGSQVQRPLATVIVGGMLIGPIMLLVVVPALQTLFLRAQPRRRVASHQRLPCKRNIKSGRMNRPVRFGSSVLTIALLAAMAVVPCVAQDNHSGAAEVNHGGEQPQRRRRQRRCSIAARRECFRRHRKRQPCRSFQKHATGTDAIDARIAPPPSHGGHAHAAHVRPINVPSPRNVLTRRTPVIGAPTPAIRNTIGVTVHPGVTAITTPGAVTPPKFRRAASASVKPVTINNGALNGTGLAHHASAPAVDRGTGPGGRRNQRHFVPPQAHGPALRRFGAALYKCAAGGSAHPRAIRLCLERVFALRHERRPPPVWNYFKIYIFNPTGRMVVAIPRRLAGARLSRSKSG